MAKKTVKEIETGVWAWIKGKWAAFEAWVDSWAPGVKTKVTTALGALGSVAAVLQQYITGLPITKFVSAETISLVTAGLFTLSFWFRGLGERVQSRA